MPFNTRVPPRRRIVPIGEDEQIGKSIAARPWSELALLANYVRGRGSMLIPNHSPMVLCASAGTATQTLRWRTQPSGLAVTRVWAVEIAGAAVTNEGTVSINGGPSKAITPKLVTGPDSTFEFLETATKTTATTELTLTATATRGAFRISKVACWELPRAQLTENATDLGVALNSLDYNRPIMALPNNGVMGLARSIAASNGRRVGIVSWAGRVRVFDDVYTPIFTFPIRIVPPKMDLSTLRTLQWDVYASADSGATGQARVVTSTLSTSSPLAINSTSLAWRGPGAHNFLCEDLTQIDGLPSGLYETVQLEVRSTVNGIFVNVESFVVWDGLW